MTHDLTHRPIRDETRQYSCKIKTLRFNTKTKTLRFKNETKTLKLKTEIKKLMFKIETPKFKTKTETSMCETKILYLAADEVTIMLLLNRHFLINQPKIFDRCVKYLFASSFNHFRSIKY